MTLLSVQNLSLTRDDKPLLNNLNFKVKHGGITLVLGANGAGKSLLLRHLHQMDDDVEGTTQWDPSLSELDRRFILQKPVLLERSVEENMRFVAKRLGLSDEHVSERLQRVGLEHKASQHAFKLSGGEKQRLVFARESLGKPKVLLLDEPTASLDPIATLEIENLIADFATTDGSAFIATHDLHQIRRLSAAVPSQVVFLEKGNLMFFGSTEDFLQLEQSKSHSVTIRLFLTGNA